MDAPDLLEQLSQLSTLADVPDAERRWLVAHGTLKRLPQGEFHTRKGDPAETLWLLLRGHMAIYVDRGLGPRRVMEWRTGDFSGGMPYSRLAVIPGNVIALEPSDLLLINRVHFSDLVRDCPTVTAKLVHILIDRARTFRSSDLQDDKMISLGRISAGLAHELNNPASAAQRSAQLLASLLDQAERATRSLAEARLSTDQLDALDRARRVCRASFGELTPLERADREDALDSWLEAHDADPDLAGMLMDTGATPESLDDLGTALQGPEFDTAARWIAACCSIRSLAGEIGTATSRIHSLVSAMKRFSYMDQAQVPEAMDLSQGLRDSISLLQHKARDRSVTLSYNIPDGLPRVRAIGGDLNQVWTNLVDNALDAASGHVTVTARAEQSAVIVSIVDDGGGIAPDIRERIFDAFFTTKGVGKGTGLGLEITRRLLQRNNGDIEVDSEPGHTEFRVLLQVAPNAPSPAPGSQT